MRVKGKRFEIIETALQTHKYLLEANDRFLVIIYLQSLPVITPLLLSFSKIMLLSAFYEIFVAFACKSSH